MILLELRSICFQKRVQSHENHFQFGDLPIMLFKLCGCIHSIPDAS